MFGLNIDPRNPKGNPDPTELYDLGVELVRFTYADPSTGNQPDAAQLQFYKEKVQAYKQVGIQSLLILNYETYPHKPGHSAGEGEWNSYIDRLARRCGQIAQQFRQWQPAFQIWNEPDHPPHPGYEPTVREAVFARMLRQCYDAIKAVDSSLFVVGGGLATGNPSWLERVRQHAGGTLPLDAIAFHPYGQRPERNWPNPNWFFGYVGDLLNNYYRAGGNKPIWITEMGVKEQDIDNNRERAAEFLRRYFSTMAGSFSNKVHHLIWFCYSDGMVPTFGLTDAAGSRKPAYDAFKQVAPSRPPLQPQPVVQPSTPGVTTTGLTPPPPPAMIPGTPVSTTGPATSTNQALTQLQQQAAAWQTRAQQLQQQLNQAQSQLQHLLDQQAQVQSQLQQLQAQPAGGMGSSVTSPTTNVAPAIQNITNQLKRDPNKQFPTRPLNQIGRIVIHHTAIPPSVGAERIANHRVDSQGWPGIGYHYFITGEGVIQQTNDLTTQSTHAGQFDSEAIGVCFAGDFTNVAPSPAQIDAGARLIAWLMPQFNLSLAAVNGYKELVITQSPGNQWDSGARWGDQLKQQIQAYL